MFTKPTLADSDAGPNFVHSPMYVLTIDIAQALFDCDEPLIVDLEYDYDYGEAGAGASEWYECGTSMTGIPPAYWPIAINGEPIDESWELEILDGPLKGETITWDSLCWVLGTKDPQGIGTR